MPEMTTHKVHSPFVDPFVFNRLRGGERRIPAKAINETQVDCCGSIYTLVENDGFRFQPGQEVFLILYNRFFHVQTEAEYQQPILDRLRQKWTDRPESER